MIVLARVIQGTLNKGQRIRLMSNGRAFDVETLGVLTPKPVEVDQLTAGEVGFLSATIKNVADTKIGDTITDDAHPAIEPLPGFEELKPMVFAGLYTVDSHEHVALREALEKLRLNDAAAALACEGDADPADRDDSAQAPCKRGQTHTSVEAARPCASSKLFPFGHKSMSRSWLHPGRSDHAFFTGVWNGKCFYQPNNPGTSPEGERSWSPKPN